MPQQNYSLTNCDIEPIHIPGAIQSHGFLIGISSQNFEVLYVSENIRDFVGLQAPEILGKGVSFLEATLHLDVFLGSLKQTLKTALIQQNFDTLSPFKLKIGQQDFYLIINFQSDIFLLEFEPQLIQHDIQGQIGSSVSEILGGKKLNVLLGNAAMEVKNLIGYDRVMIYKFAEDDHGEVVSEVKNDDLDPFLGLHYPATDIPKPARALYLKNLVRLIADVHTSNADILSNTNEALDLTKSQLRAVSPIHVQYLKNMGVASSFSISIIAHGRLWGLIACHNYTPRFIDIKARHGAKLIGQILSSAIEYRQDEEDTERNTQFKDAANELVLNLNKDISIVDALTKFPTTIQDVNNSAGAAILYEGTVTLIGKTPPLADVEKLSKWLFNTLEDQPVFCTENLKDLYPHAEDFISTGAGVMAAVISRELKELIIWFKPEKLTTVHWAGNPEKRGTINEIGMLEMSPRTSFETWIQEVKNVSEVWLPEEVNTARDIRERITGAINKRITQVRMINDQLKAAYEELDSFSYTISHDLRSPLTAVKTYAEFLMRNNSSLDDKAKSILGKILKGADKMNGLIKDVLELSRVSRSNFDFETINVAELVNETVSELKIVYSCGDDAIEIGDLPKVKGDPTLLGQVFSNLIGNAVKYSSNTTDQYVKIHGYQDNGETIYEIKDNGVGIDSSYHSRVFDLFKRMDNALDFEGTGVGLAIVKRIVDRHQGRIWFDSELNKGSSFYVAFKN